MTNIIKLEFRKFFKSIYFIIISLMTVILPIFMAGLYKVLEFFPMPDDMPMLEGFISNFGAFQAGFNPADNFGLIFLIFLIIIIVNDFTQGTIKNKIVAGFSRKNIYLANTVFLISIVSVFITLYTSLIYVFVGFSVGFADVSFSTIFLYWLTALSANFVIIAFIQFIAYRFKTIGASLGIGLGTVFLVMLIYVILSMGLTEKTKDILLYIVPPLQLFSPTVKNTLDSLIMFLVNLIYFSGITLLGIRMNKKQDYK